MHLTHTFVSKDPRVLRAHLAGGGHPGYESKAVGLIIGGSEKTTRKDITSIRASKFLWERSFIRFGIRPGYLIGRALFFAVQTQITAQYLWKAFLFRPNIVHCHGWLPLPAASVIRRFFRTTLIYDAHELESETQGIHPDKKRYIVSLEHKNWRFIDYLVTVSPSIQSWYLSNFGHKKSSLILNCPSFIDSRTPQTQNHQIRKFLQISEDAVIFVYFGAFVAGRAIDRILEVFGETRRKAVVVFIGEGPLEGLIQSKAEKCENIRILGLMSHSELGIFCQTADYGLCLIENVSLSDYYSLPNKLFEYASLGLNVVASQTPDVCDLVKKWDLGVCIDDSISALAKFVLRSERVDTKARRGACSVLPLTWEAQSENLIAIYSGLVNEK